SAGLDDSKLDLDRVGIYLGSGEGSLDFDAFSMAAVAAWHPESGKLDAVKWAEIAFERMNAIRELEQEPNMPLSHLALLTGARGPTPGCRRPTFTTSTPTAPAPRKTTATKRWPSARYSASTPATSPSPRSSQ